MAEINNALNFFPFRLHSRPVILVFITFVILTKLEDLYFNARTHCRLSVVQCKRSESEAGANMVRSGAAPPQ